MSATDYYLTAGITGLDAAAGTLDMAGLSDLFADLAVVDNVDQAVTLIDAAAANISEGLTDAQADTVRGVADSLAESVRVGEIRPDQAPWALEWAGYYLGHPRITADDLATGQLRVWLQMFAAAHGWTPPAAVAGGVQPAGLPGRIGGDPVAWPAPGGYTPPAGTPTPGRQAVAAGLADVGAQTVPVPGLGQATLAGLSAAFAQAAADSARATADALDAMLPGEAPGQVPADLARLNAATDRLINQVRSVWQTLGAPHVGGVEEEVRRLQVSAHTLTEAADRLEAQLRGDDRSKLLDMIRADGRRLDNQGGWLHTVAEVLPTLAPLSVVSSLEAEWRHVEAQLSERSPSFLFDTVRGLETETKAIRQTVATNAKTALECCEEFQTAQREVGGKSAWPKLGGLLKWAFIVPLVVGIVETVGAIADPSAFLMAVAADTELVTGWVVDSTPVVTGDLGWADRIAGIAP